MLCTVVLVSLGGHFLEFGFLHAFVLFNLKMFWNLFLVQLSYTICLFETLNKGSISYEFSARKADCIKFLVNFFKNTISELRLKNNGPVFTSLDPPLPSFPSVAKDNCRELQRSKIFVGVITKPDHYL